MEMELSVIINRPVEQVYAFTVDPTNVPLWMVGIQEAGWAEGNTLAKGAKTRAVGTVLGKRFESVATVADFEPNRGFTLLMSQPFPQTVHHSYEPVSGGTRLTMKAQFEPGGFFKLAMPILGGMLRRQTETSLANLKDVLEAQTAVV